MDMGGWLVRLHVGVYKFIYLALVPIVVGGLFVLTACSAWDRSPTIGSQSDKSPSIGSQPFIVDTSVGQQQDGVEPPLFTLLSRDGQQKLEIFNGGKVELYVSQSGQWEWVQTGQGGGSQVVGLCVGQFGVLEVVDPNINRMVFETKTDKKELSFIEVKSHRFVAFQNDYTHSQYYQIFGFSKDGEAIWQEFPDGYWD